GGALKLAALGVLFGVAGAAAFARLLTSLLYGVTASDPRTFVSVAVVLLAVALAAALVPSWRASRVDPTVALRALAGLSWALSWPGCVCPTQPAYRRTYGWDSWRYSTFLERARPGGGGARCRMFGAGLFVGPRARRSAGQRRRSRIADGRRVTGARRRLSGAPRHGDDQRRRDAVSHAARHSEPEHRGRAAGGPARDQLGRRLGGPHQRRHVPEGFLQREEPARRVVLDERHRLSRERQWLRGSQHRLHGRVQSLFAVAAVHRRGKQHDRRYLRRCRLEHAGARDRVRRGVRGRR